MKQYLFTYADKQYKAPHTVSFEADFSGMSAKEKLEYLLMRAVIEYGNDHQSIHRKTTYSFYVVYFGEI